MREAETTREAWKFEGLRNVGFLALILAAISLRNPPGMSEALMLAAATGSYFATPKPIHAANEFSFHPIREVGWLFLGIFATMVPALDYLEVHAKEWGCPTFFWLTGVLAAALDNAPTYLTFLAAATGLHGLIGFGLGRRHHFKTTKIIHA